MQQAKALDYPHRSVEQRKSCMRIFSAKTMFNLFYIVRRYIFCFAHHIFGSWRLAESCRKGAPCLRKPPWSRTNKNYGCSRTDPLGIVQRINYGRVQVFWQGAHNARNRIGGGERGGRGGFPHPKKLTQGSWAGVSFSVSKVRQDHKNVCQMQDSNLRTR